MDGIKSTVKTKIEDVRRRELVRKSDQKPFTKFEVTTPDGTVWETFKAEVATKAMRHQKAGSEAELEVTIKKNGDFTNYYLDAVTNEAPAQADGAIQAAAEVGMAKSPDVDFATFAKFDKEKEDAKNVSIHRQVAGKVAAQISETAGEFWENVQHIYGYFQTGTVPSLYGPDQKGEVSKSPVTSHAAFEDTDTSEGDGIPF